jgi:aryl-alcohol dehydrogenase-like predicted oxidoreductase
MHVAPRRPVAPSPPSPPASYAAADAMVPSPAGFCLGTVQLGITYGAGNITGLPSEERAVAIVLGAVDRGVAALDTARSYGLSEERIGIALRRLAAQGKMRPSVVTKIDGRCSASVSAAESERIVGESLAQSSERLALPVLDTCLLHHYQMYTDYDGAAWNALLAAQQRGEVRI